MSVTDQILHEAKISIPKQLINKGKSSRHVILSPIEEERGFRIKTVLTKYTFSYKIPKCVFLYYKYDTYNLYVKGQHWKFPCPPTLVRLSEIIIFLCWGRVASVRQIKAVRRNLFKEKFFL